MLGQETGAAASSKGVGGDAFHQELGLEHVELEASVILENMFEIRREFR